MTIGNALRFVVGEIKNFEATFLIRGGVLEVVPKQETAREVMLNYPVTAVFKSRIFHHAIQELADETGVSIVVDGKLEKLGEKTVTASFHNGVAVQDAVRMLAELVDLKVVHLPTGLFITSPEHAKKMRMELDELYERQPGQPSPLAPPLPPLARSQGAAASIRMPLAKQ
jgi:hypothetical protein